MPRFIEETVENTPYPAPAGGSILDEPHYYFSIQAGHYPFVLGVGFGYSLGRGRDYIEEPFQRFELSEGLYWDAVRCDRLSEVVRNYARDIVRRHLSMAANIGRKPRPWQVRVRAPLKGQPLPKPAEFALKLQAAIQNEIERLWFDYEREVFERRGPGSLSHLVAEACADGRPG